LQAEEEFGTDGGGQGAESVNAVRDVPEGFKRWINDPISRAKSWESVPCIIRGNKGYIREDFKVNVYNKAEGAFVRKRRTNLGMGRAKYCNKA